MIKHQSRKYKKPVNHLAVSSLLGDSIGTLVCMYRLRLSSYSRSFMLSEELLEHPGTGHLTHRTSNINCSVTVKYSIKQTRKIKMTQQK